MLYNELLRYQKVSKKIKRQHDKYMSSLKNSNWNNKNGEKYERTNMYIFN